MRPNETTEEHEAADAKATGETMAATRRLLIVDDDDEIRNVFGLLLGSAFPDVPIDEAPDGVEAIERFREHRHRVIVMDLMMPKMDGRRAFETLEKTCAEQNWEMPAVVFCTGFSPPTVIQEIVASQKKHCLLSKPVRRDTLIDHVEQRL